MGRSQTIAQSSARFLERRGLLERDAEQAYLTAEAGAEDPMESLQGPKLPRIIATDEGIWRRIQHVPFEYQVPPEWNCVATETRTGSSG